MMSGDNIGGEELLGMGRLWVGNILIVVEYLLYHSEFV